MTELEFKAFIGLVDNAYPKQKLLNNTQKGFFWLAKSLSDDGWS